MGKATASGDWLKADCTTLGADNGIAIALALTIAEDENASHPPLELFFTVEEEIGIGGASSLDPGLVSGFEKKVKSEYARTDGGLTLSLTPALKEDDLAAVGLLDSEKIVQLMMALPHGVVRMSASIEGFVETSTNLAIVNLDENGLHVTTNQRSMAMSRLDEINRRVEAIAHAHLAGAEVRHAEGYPAWQPAMDSPLLERCVSVYETLFEQRPEVKMIHAGLECGIIGDRCGGMDMISFGPTIKNVHSPRESLYIPPVERVWSLLNGLLGSFV